MAGTREGKNKARGRDGRGSWVSTRIRPTTSMRSRGSQRQRRTAHLDSHSEALEHLVAAKADEVQPDDLLLRARADHLHRSRLLLVGLHHRVVQRREGRLVNLDLVVAVLLARLGLGLCGETGGQHAFARAAQHTRSKRSVRLVGEKDRDARGRQYRWSGACKRGEKGHRVSSSSDSTSPAPLHPTQPERLYGKEREGRTRRRRSGCSRTRACRPRRRRRACWRASCPQRWRRA